MALINGTEHGASSITVVMFNGVVPEETIVAISYKSKREKVNVWGLGAEPIRRARGKKDYEASITVLGSFIDTLQKSLPPGKDLTDIAPFNITVGYNDEQGNYTVDKLEYVEFLENPKGGKSGDTHFEHELPLVIGRIKANV